MGNTNASENAKNRRYSRSSGFQHWMDNIKDKKILKISLKQTSTLQGTFTLNYLDDSSDDFLVIRSTFTFTGRYQQAGPGEERDPFGVGIHVSPRGNIIIENTRGDHNRKTVQNRSESVYITQKNQTTEEADSTTKRASPGEDDKLTVLKTTRFFTEKLVCRLTEGKSTQNWTIVPSTLPDCLEKTPEQIAQSVSWPWSGNDGSKESHKAPPGTLDFLGEEIFEPGGANTIDLKIRIPQLAAGHSPPVVVLNEVGGWKLGRKSMPIGRS